MKKIKIWLQDRLNGLIDNILWIAALAAIPSVLFILNVLSTTIRVNFIQSSVPFWMWVTFAIAITIIVLFIFVLIYKLVDYIRCKDSKPQFPRLNLNVHITECTQELYFKDREHIEYRLTVKFNVIQEKLKELTLRFGWTGSTYIKAELEENPFEYTLVDSVNEKYFHCVHVNFNNELVKSEKGSFTLKIFLGDSEKCLQPFLSRMIKSPTDKLIMRIVVPSKKFIKNVKYGVYADLGAELPLEKTTKLSAAYVGDRTIYEYCTDAPSLLYNYRIDWNF